MAARIHIILQLAHAQESALMQVDHPAPLERTVDDIRAGNECYIGAYHAGQLVGTVSFAPDSEPGQWLISLLVVHPEHQRQGIARSLMNDVLQRGSGDAFAVFTGANNIPALSLYHRLGFVPYRLGSIGAEFPPLIKLRRAPTEPTTSAPTDAHRQTPEAPLDRQKTHHA